MYSWNICQNSFGKEMGDFSAHSMYFWLADLLSDNLLKASHDKKEIFHQTSIT
jgi:hypothetical protein